MALQPFPTEFPVEALPVLAAYLRKQKSVADAANAGWNVMGWAGGSFLPANPSPQLSGEIQMAVARGGDEEVAKKFDEAYNECRRAATPDAQKALFGSGAILSLLGPLLIQVATRLVNQWLGGGNVGTTKAPGQPT